MLDAEPHAKHLAVPVAVADGRSLDGARGPGANDAVANGSIEGGSIEGGAGRIGAGLIEGLRHKVAALRREVEAGEFTRMQALLDAPDRDAEALRDALSTRLMECFRTGSSRGCFGLLYELNSTHLLTQVASCLRRYGSKADPRDVLQEVFFNIYRYPHRFNCEREDAFRVWTAMIVRNTVLKHLRAQGRTGRHEIAFEDLSDQPAERTARPDHGMLDREAMGECGRVYLTYLHLYLRFYSMLSPRERSAIHMVEVEEISYRDAADRLGIKLENLKMVIFRARRKIHRSMKRVFDGLPPDCRPARDPARAALEAGAPEPAGAALPPDSRARQDSQARQRNLPAAKPLDRTDDPVPGDAGEAGPERGA